MNAPCNRQGSRRPVVLVAHDGSSSAATALPFAQLAAQRLDAELEILYVAATPEAAVDLGHPNGLAVAGLQGTPVRVLVGDPATQLLRSAADPEVALLALTTHGRMPEIGRTLGRVAAAVVARTEWPVLLIRPEAALEPTAPADGLPTLQRFLVPLDGTPTTARALTPITALALRLGVSLDFLLVAAGEDGDDFCPVEPGSICAPRYVDQPQHEWPAWQRAALDRLATVCAKCPADVPRQMFLACGRIGEEILRAACQHQADVLVLVRRSSMEPGHGAVIRQVLACTPCPILLIGKPTRSRAHS